MRENSCGEPEDELEHEHKKRKVPKPTETVFGSRSTECKEDADGLYF